VWIAIKTKIIKENIDFKVPVQYFSLVLTDVLRTQLHFACTDVISVLNECSVEHYPAD